MDNILGVRNTMFSADSLSYVKGSDTKQNLLTAIVMALILGFVGSILWEGNDEQKEQDHYCQMVADGYWPEYKKG